MSHKYSYLKEFLPPHPEFDGTNRNQFFEVHKKEIKEISISEKKLGFIFPKELIEFYTCIGYGFLCAPYGVSDGYTTNEINLILSPNITLGLYKSLKPEKWPEDTFLPIEVDDYYMSGSTFELLKPGDLPFFEISNGSQFLIMRPHSDNPNAVWSDTGVKIEDSFEKFIWRLYYESPCFYDKILEAHYAKQ